MILFWRGPYTIYQRAQILKFVVICKIGDCKLDPTLISALMERWRLETHIFHLPCGECTITLEDITLQLGLPVDGSIVTGSVIVLDKEDLYEFGTHKMATTPNRLQRIWSTKLEISRVGHVVQGVVSGNGTR
ncbi:hypothetical protein PVK06_019506 [Gossypium arboreum]|uniref:Aminotransferase-like plant mobile domain-containing protein n=1 Tax=Gossypium arboreum TaxID=29729 RepID=A0ABR0PJW1_GOSAR|nr:hypothetical protein PVK06_019506 [Gossypium arboreum]